MRDPGNEVAKSRFSPYIHCKFCRVCPTPKMTSATVKPSIELLKQITMFAEKVHFNSAYRSSIVETALSGGW